MKILKKMKGTLERVPFKIKFFAFTRLEFLIGIPGTIGGGIKMNSGAFGSEFKDVLIDVKAINHDGEYKIFSNEDLHCPLKN